MPTYDYICETCNHEFEAFESIKADPQTECPACHAASLRRKIGPGAAILFKGSGFYQTDYRSDSYKKAAKADSNASKPADSGGGNGSAAKSDSKPAAAPATGGASSS